MTAPAVRIGVFVRHPFEQQSAGGHVGHQGLVGVFEELSADQGTSGASSRRLAPGSLPAAGCTAAHREVISAECRGQVYDARAVAGGDEIPRITKWASGMSTSSNGLW